MTPNLIVGIGASAGGLEACKRFLAEMPPESGMAFVLVMHLDPTHQSHIAEILATVTTMNVVQITGVQRIDANHVYVIAPDSSLEIRDGVLNPHKPNDPEGRRKPIDAFFVSLAEDRREHAVAVVLSGSGNNGSVGIQDIHAKGGLCIAQDPGTALYDAMPSATIASGVADHILSPEAMPAVLVAYAAKPHAPRAPTTGAATEKQPEAFGGVLNLLSKKHRLDFRAYKRGTLQRRTERRMALKQIPGWPQYLELLQQDPQELAALYGDLLIGVTHFFRDAEIWEHLEKEIAPRLLEERTEDAPLRIWVSGCATGEEPYSLAILFLEQLARMGRTLKPQIYATDVNESAVAFARRGVYPATIAADVSPERLERFFRKQGEGFHVCQEVRDAVTFAVHNLLTDSPFSKQDLVSCRNLLIYLEPNAQERVLEVFHFALRKGGLLLLGSSETIGRQGDLFETLSKQHRIYQARPSTRASQYPLPQKLADGTALRGLPALPRPAKGTRGARLVEQLVMSRYTSACVAINRRCEILYFFGPTHHYLVQPTGEARLDLLSWTRPGLFPKLRSALRGALDQKEKATTITGMRMKRDGVACLVECTIEPMPSLAGAEDLFLVAFRDDARVPVAETGAVSSELAEPVVRQLEAELKEARDELQNTVEQLDGTNAEYRASHEELLSLNEELQSSNEELVSSKEELQSLNEETVTINRQLEEKNAELRTTNTDLHNLFVSTEIPTVFLDRELRVRRFTPAATAVMRLVPSDAGRSIEHIKLRVRDESLLADAATVMQTRTPLSAEVTSEDDRWYVRRIVPYRTDDDRIEGVSLTFVEITAQKKAALEIDEARRYAESIAHTIRTPFVVLDTELRVVSANDRFYESFRVSIAETLNRRIYDLGNRQWDIPRLRDLLENVLPAKEAIKDYEVEHAFEHLGLRLMRLNAKRMTRTDRPSLILLAIEDVTERRNAEVLARQRVDELAQEHHRKDEFLAMLGHELRNPLSALAHGLALLGKGPHDEARSIELREMMTRQTERIGGILDQLLDLARVVSGKVQLATHRLDLADIVRAAIETVRPFTEAHKHTLTLSLPRESARVMGDAVRLTQVVENLLTNAVAYTSDGGRISVTLEADGDMARIAVRDNGDGMEADLLPHVFELFTQAPRTLERAKGGLGLGLPLVQRLVEMHGGQVTASSPGLGRGSEFVVTLPRVRDAVSTTRPAPAPPGAIHPRRILVVDDEPFMASALAELLADDGHRTLAVNDGMAALTAARTFDPEVVLLDLGLPEIDGYEVARRLRKEHSGRKILLIAVTGYQRDVERLAEAGFDDHLIKPANLQTLAALIAALDEPPTDISAARA